MGPPCSIFSAVLPFAQRVPSHCGRTRRERGEIVARTLHRFWDATHVVDVRRDECARVAPLLIAQGVGAIGFERLRDVAAPVDASTLRDAHTRHRTRCLNRERRLVRVVKTLDAAGIEHLIWKGWTLARWYPDRGLRPYGDVDVLVHPARYEAASRALDPAVVGEPLNVDLHWRINELVDDTFDGLLARSRATSCHGVRVRTLGREDELRHACLHWLKHGGERPLWLCDIALLLERPDAADMNLADVLGSDPTHAAWILQTLRLASTVLGARSELPIPTVASVDDWTVDALLQEWGAVRFTRKARAVDYLDRPARWTAVVRDRWPSAISAAVSVGLRPTDAPLPAQLRLFTTSAWDFTRQVLAVAGGLSRTRRSA